MRSLMTIAEFQKIYSVSRATVYRLAKRKEFQFVHIGRSVRIRTEDAERWYASLGEDSANAQ